MKTSPFDLGKALQGAPCVTRDGRRILALHKFDMKIEQPIIAVVEDEDGDHPISLSVKGYFYIGDDIESHNDLFMLEPDEVKTTGLNFGEALEAMKDGKHITRACWKNKAIQVFIRNPSFAKDVKELRVITVQGLNCPWIPNHQELLANDWMIV